MPSSGNAAGSRFFIKEAGIRVGTPLLAVVVAIDAAGLVFAVDSVPAVLAVSDDPPPHPLPANARSAQRCGPSDGS